VLCRCYCEGGLTYVSHLVHYLHLVPEDGLVSIAVGARFNLLKSPELTGAQVDDPRHHSKTPCAYLFVFEEALLWGYASCRRWGIVTPQAAPMPASRGVIELRLNIRCGKGHAGNLEKTGAGGEPHLLLIECQLAPDKTKGCYHGFATEVDVDWAISHSRAGLNLVRSVIYG